MNEPEVDDVPPGMLRSLQIIVGALVASIFFFAVVAVVVRSKEGGPPAIDPPVISYLAIAFAAMTLGMRAVMIPAIAKVGRKPLLTEPYVATRQLMGLLTNRTIIGSALLEGAAFFLLVAYLVEGQLWTWAGGLVMGGVLAVLQFPTAARIGAAVDAERQAIADERTSA
jgi:hypothetical protein